MTEADNVRLLISEINRDLHQSKQSEMCHKNLFYVIIFIAHCSRESTSRYTPQVKDLLNQDLCTAENQTSSLRKTIKGRFLVL